MNDPARPAGVADEWLARALRLPPPPAERALPGARLFHASPAYLTMRRVRWVLVTIAGALGVVWGMWFLAKLTGRIPARFEGGIVTAGRVRLLVAALEIAGVIGFILKAIGDFLLTGLDYRWRWYLLTDRALIIREGLWTVREKTMSFANLQNLEIRQGPLLRLFGLYDLEVCSAGGGGQSKEEQRANELAGEEPPHAACFRGVDNPEEIRAAILARLRQRWDAGLGDPDDAHAPAAPSAADPELAAAAREFTAAARELREALADR